MYKIKQELNIKNQEAIAKKSGISPRQLYRIGKGLNTRKPTAMALCKALGIKFSKYFEEVK